MNAIWGGAALLCSLLIWLSGPAWADGPEGGFKPSVNDFGGTGLLQMPNARFQDDGELNFGASVVDPYRRYFFTLQGLPWLEGTFRYTDITNQRNPGSRESGRSQSTKDRGIDLKVLLLEESRHNAQVAVGLRDILGTSLFGSEFLVASRRHYNWDFTLGMAWGNAGSRGHLSNPLGRLNDKFKDRGSGNSEGGQLTFNYFQGDDVALFGGIEYLTPLDGLRLKVEYDGNDYQSEPFGNQFETDLPVNFGAEYDLFPWFRIAAGFERGNEFLVRGNVHSNLNTDKGPSKVDSPPPVLTPRKDENEEENTEYQLEGRTLAALQAPANKGDTSDPKTWALSVDQMFDRFEALGLVISGIAFEGRSAIVRVPVEGQRSSRASLAYAALVIARLALAGPIDVVRFVATKDDMEIARTNMKTADLERSAALTGSPIALVKPPEPEWAAAFEPIGASLASATAGTSGGRSRTTARYAIDQIAAAIFAELRQQGFRGERFDIEDQRAILSFSQGKYRNPAKAIGRAARIVARHAPRHIEEISLVLYDVGVPISLVTVLRSDLERAVMQAGSAEEIWQHATIEAAAMPTWGTGIVNDARHPQMSASVLPQVRTQIGGPDKFVFYQFWLEGATELELAPGLTANGSVGVNIYENFGSLQLESDSELPRVRSDINEYLKEGKQWINTLYSSYITKFAPEWYGRVSGGILEWMYSGVDGEVLYRPTGKRWALGLDLNHVWQRDFDGEFGLQNYDVTTGHVTYYHRLPFYEVLAAVSAGRYLAKDKGATVELSRTFDSGVTFGVFATKTDVSSKEFGEGSFDKGFFMSMPLDLFSATPTRQHAGFLFRPLSRDGGQRVIIPKPLYPLTSDADPRAIGQGWGEFLY